MEPNSDHQLIDSLLKPKPMNKDLAKKILQEIDSYTDFEERILLPFHPKLYEQVKLEREERLREMEKEEMKKKEEMRIEQLRPLKIKDILVKRGKKDWQISYSKKQR